MKELREFSDIEDRINEKNQHLIDFVVQIL